MSMLDNAVWHSLEGPHGRFAQALGRAKRFDPAVAPFAALPDDVSPSTWADLAALVGPGRAAVLFRAEVELPDGWETLAQFRGMQMTHDGPLGTEPIDAVDLTARDVPEMLALIGRNEPGPFAERTLELGRYLGVRRKGALVAMAGERLRLPGFVEISAVCTDLEHRGQGLAAGLVRLLVAGIRGRGDTPILHVVESNVPAIRLYESLGFVIRRPLDGMVLRPPVVR